MLRKKKVSFKGLTDLGINLDGLTTGYQVENQIGYTYRDLTDLTEKKNLPKSFEVKGKPLVKKAETRSALG